MARIGISYGRFSSQKQKKGRSWERQLLRSQRFARRHRLALDETLSCFDEGLSGFWGDHAMKGALSRFVALCGTPRVPAGSVLIVEDFDRLSRQTPDDAWELFRKILMSGVEIAVLSLDRWFTKGALNSFEDRIVVQASQHRAHEESKRKSDHATDVWKSRRKRAREGAFRPTNLPGWCRWVRADGKRHLELIPEREATLLEMVRRYEAGEGVERVAAALNRDPAHPCWLKRGLWNGVSVYDKLTSPQLWGAYQPRKYAEARKVVDVGKPIPGCYPAAITRERAAALAATLRARKTNRGRLPREDRATLRRLVYDVTTGRPCTLRNGGKKPRGEVTVYLARPTPHGQVLVISYPVLEDLVLRVVQQWTPDALAAAPTQDGAAAARECGARLREIDERRQALRAALRTAKASTVAHVTEALDALEDEEAAVRAALDEAEQRRAPSAASLGAAQSLALQLRGAPAGLQGAVRLKLNAALRDLLGGVWLHRQELGDRKAAVYVQVWPRAGACAYAVAMVGRPPAGWVPLDLAGQDFRTWRGR